MLRIRCALISALAFLLLACGERAAPPSNQTPVILISIDTLRSDHLPAYGYNAVETPNIDAFRRDSILYQHAYSHVPLTLPSHASMLTGVYPAEHGVRDNLAFTLKPEVPTLAELLKKNGYATGAAVSSFVMRGETGLGRGFDFYEDRIDAGEERLNPGAVQRSGFDTATIAKKWMSDHREKPFFFMLHIYEPHFPYEAPEPFRTKYAASPYDGEVAASDAIVGNVIDFLKENKLYDQSLIILLSDHGEGLMDHGEDEHGIFLYREAIQVPLLVKLPHSAHRGKTVATAVQLSDVFPTIATQTATTWDSAGIRGESLLDFLDQPRERQVFSESYFAQIHFGWSPLHSLVDGRNHFIRAPKPELYDVEKDPAEKNNIISANRRTFHAMQQALEPLVSEPTERRVIDPEEARKLAALGYLGGTTTPGKPGQEKPDPKDQLGTLQEIKLAFGMFRDRRDQEAIPLFQKLVRSNPEMFDMWDALSRALYRSHRYEEAVAAGGEALRISPASSHVAALIANSLLELQRFDAAREHAELVMSRNAAQGHEILARIDLALKNRKSAREHAEIARKSELEQIAALITLARVENEEGNPQAALKLADEIEALMRARKIENVARVHFTRGDAFARMARPRDAEREFREEIRLFPRDPQAYKNLFLLFLAERRPDAARAVIFELEKNAPSPATYLAIAETLQAIGDPGGARFWLRRGRERFPDDVRLKSASM